MPLAAFALAAAGCSSGGTGSSFTERFSQAFAGGNPAPVAPAAEAGNLDSCPNVDIRQGAGTYAVRADGRDPSAMQLRYQIAIAQTARECVNVGGNLVIKVGVQGRLVLGPVGGPGTIEVPLRYALVEEGVEPKTLWTKMHSIPITIPEGQPHLTFTHVEEGISVPMPPNAAFDNYVVYVGFDPLGMKQQPERRRPAPRR